VRGLIPHPLAAPKRESCLEEVRTVFTTWVIALVSMMLLLALVSYTAWLSQREGRLSGKGPKAGRQKVRDRHQGMPKAA
jgi:hypothetical protein